MLVYSQILVFFSITLAVGLLLIGLAYQFGKRRYDDESDTLSAYECGFAPFEHTTRLPFEIHFYIIAVLFLIFDVEIMLLIPGFACIANLTFESLIVIFVFLVILLIGFGYELFAGALMWPIHVRV